MAAERSIVYFQRTMLSIHQLNFYSLIFIKAILHAYLNKQPSCRARKAPPANAGDTKRNEESKETQVKRAKCYKRKTKS